MGCGHLLSFTIKCRTRISQVTEDNRGSAMNIGMLSPRCYRNLTSLASPPLASLQTLLVNMQTLMELMKIMNFHG